MEERLQKYLAGAGVASRRASEKLIAEGRVEVNGRIVTEQGVKIDPERDVVKVNGKPVRPEEELVYLLLNKPAGYVTTVSDPQGRPTVMDLLQDVQVRVFPVGRLDYETEGALLFTNDGELSFRMTHPKFELVKTYVATLQGQVSEEKLGRLRQGVKLEDGMTRPQRSGCSSRRSIRPSWRSRSTRDASARSSAWQGHRPPGIRAQTHRYRHADRGQGHAGRISLFDGR